MASIKLQGSYMAEFSTHNAKDWGNRLTTITDQAI